MKDTHSAFSSLIVSVQPLNPRQAMVKRLSVVNLENFRRQYARRRWKVNMDYFLIADRIYEDATVIDFGTRSLCLLAFLF